MDLVALLRSGYMHGIMRGENAYEEEKIHTWRRFRYSLVNLN